MRNSQYKPHQRRTTYYDETLDRTISYKEPLFIVDISTLLSDKKVCGGNAQSAQITDVEPDSPFAIDDEPSLEESVESSSKSTIPITATHITQTAVTHTSIEKFKLQFMFALHDISSDACNILRCIYLYGVDFTVLKRFDQLKPSSINYVLDSSAYHSTRRLEYTFEKIGPNKLIDYADELYKNCNATLCIVEHDAGKEAATTQGFLSLWWGFLNGMSKEVERYAYTADVIISCLTAAGFKIIKRINVGNTIRENPVYSYCIVCSK